MITIRRSGERGHADHGWLDTFHTFSFADYHDPAHMGFRSLRVINEDRVKPGMGFGAHPHRDMEILTYVLDGALAHKDSMGNGRTIGAGELQAMSAGTGITHSELNASSAEPVHFLQIWTTPDRKGVAPRYAEWSPKQAGENALTLVASRDSREGSVAIHQDADLFLGDFEGKLASRFELKRDHAAWVQVMTGELEVNGRKLNTGDGAAIEEEQIVELASASGAKFLLFDLA